MNMVSNKEDCKNHMGRNIKINQDKFFIFLNLKNFYE